MNDVLDFRMTARTSPDRISFHSPSLDEQGDGSPEKNSEGTISSSTRRNRLAIGGALVVAGGLAVLSAGHGAFADEEKKPSVPVVPAAAAKPEKPAEQDSKKPVGVLKAEAAAAPTAPIASPTNTVANTVAAVGSKDILEVPKEWRWYYKQANGEFHIVLDRATNTYRFEVIKSRRVKPEKAPRGEIQGAFPKTEEAARWQVILAIAQWEKIDPKKKETHLEKGFLMQNGLDVFKKLAP